MLGFNVKSLISRFSMLLEILEQLTANLLKSKNHLVEAKRARSKAELESLEELLKSDTEEGEALERRRWRPSSSRLSSPRPLREVQEERKFNSILLLFTASASGHGPRHILLAGLLIAMAAFN